MKKITALTGILSLLLTALLQPNSVYANDQKQLTALFTKALLAYQQNEDRSVVNRLLMAALEIDPDNPKVTWQLLWLRNHLWHDGNRNLKSRAPQLAYIAPEVKKIIDGARQRDDIAFSHYVMARYSGGYNQFDIALKEIGKALKIEPESARYLYVKADLLGDRGSWEWEKRHHWLEESIRVLRQTLALIEKKPSLYITQSNVFFALAQNNSSLKDGDPQKTIEYYLKSLNSNGGGSQPEFAWNNMSIAYRKNGQCKKAQEAAEKALKIKKFGAARTNRRYALFCQKMAEMGIAKREKTP